MSGPIDLCGKKFGRWTVLDGPIHVLSKKGRYWLCLCECGTIRAVKGQALLNVGKRVQCASTSCGCAKLERMKSNNPIRHRWTNRTSDLLGAKAGLTATVTVRLIQSSPYADPKLVEEARKFERELKAQGLEEPIDPDREAPLILPLQPQPEVV